MGGAILLNKEYSTTRYLTRTSLATRNNDWDAKFPSCLSSSLKSVHREEGGLRTQGLIKGGGDSGAVDESRSCARPLVSIITVVFNGDIHIERTIRSVLNQSYENVEYIVIDGGSTDNTLEILRNYNDQIDYWVSERDNGIYDAMNKGIRLASGATIGLLNCGDTYEPWFVEKLIAKLRGRADISRTVLYTHFKVELDGLAVTQYHQSHMAYWRGMSICHQAMLIGKAIYSDLGSYDTSYRLAADYEFLLRMATRGVSFVGVDVYGITFMHTGQSSSYNQESQKEARRINRAYFGSLSVRHLVFAVRSWHQIFVYYYLKKVLYRFLGRRLTNRIRLIKKSIFGFTKPSCE